VCEPPGVRAGASVCQPPGVRTGANVCQPPGMRTGVNVCGGGWSSSHSRTRLAVAGPPGPGPPGRAHVPPPPWSQQPPQHLRATHAKVPLRVSRYTRWRLCIQTQRPRSLPGMLAGPRRARTCSMVPPCTSWRAQWRHCARCRGTRGDRDVPSWSFRDRDGATVDVPFRGRPLRGGPCGWLRGHPTTATWPPWAPFASSKSAFPGGGGLGSVAGRARVTAVMAARRTARRKRPCAIRS
jgi:hypothetical protein